MRHWDGQQGGITVNGTPLNNIRYADDTVILSDTPQGLQTLVDRVIEVGTEYGLEFNAAKTKYMVVSRDRDMTPNLKVGRTTLERVKQISYLGCTLNDSWDHSREIRQRIEKARSVFLRMRNVFSSNSLSLDLRKKMIKCYVYSVLLYGVEAWTLTEATCRRVEAFEALWIMRRILKVGWTEHVTNEEVLRRMKTERELMRTIKIRKLAYLGHVMRNEKYSLLQLVLQGKIEGRRPPGRRRTSWLKNLRQWYGMTSVEVFRAAVNKVKIALMIAQIR